MYWKPPTLQSNPSPRNNTSILRNPQPPRITFSHPLSTTIPPTHLNLSTRSNRQPHTRSRSLTNRCQCITNILHITTCTRRSRAISPMLRCTTGTTVTLRTRHRPLSCTPPPSITRNAHHCILNTLARPSCSVPFLPHFPRQPPAIKIPQQKLWSPPATKIKSRTILRRTSTSGRLAFHHLLSLRRTSWI